MADPNLSEDDEELIPVETPIDAEPEDEADQDDADEGDDHDDGDERLASSEDEQSDEVISANRKRRQKRKEQVKQAREAQERELNFLRQQTAVMAQRLAAVEGNALSQNEMGIDQRIAEANREAETARIIMERAIDAGNGADVTAAMGIREQALRNAQYLQAQKAQVAQVRQQVLAPQPDQRVASYAQEWLNANPWYDPTGRDEDSAITAAIDAAMTREGHDPTAPTYWTELTRRVAARIGDEPARAETPRRRAPPTGNSREHAPVSTRREVFVTAERKAAMIEAGVWDDPVARNRMLKAYQAYDKQTAS
jgi:hypothetical protein